jgi:hypothetical protein|tara:strand:+ start:248 stop:358 length:111 start_codon:yes stop_codon:yes gene_type:complete
MKNIIIKISTIVIGLAIGAIVYFSLWAVFVYFGVVT